MLLERTLVGGHAVRVALLDLLSLVKMQVRIGPNLEHVIDANQEIDSLCVGKCRGQSKQQRTSAREKRSRNGMHASLSPKSLR
jgi:hypothetical protein